MLGMVAGVAGAAAACRRGSGATALADDGDVAPSPAPKTRVRSHAATLRDAIDRAGGLGFAGRGDVVVLKVNTNSGDPYPFSTSPTAIRVIAGALVAAGARVVVGDRSFWGDDDTAGNLAANGIAAATRDAGAELMVFDDRVDWVEIDPDRVPSWRPPFHLPRVVVEADHVINLACLKTHFITGVTLGLKNMLGVVKAQDRARPGNLRVHHDELIHRQIADVNRVIAPRLTVIDGYRALITGGPTRHDGKPTFADTRTILAGSDRIALDVAAIALLQRHAPDTEAVHRTAPDEHPTIVATRAALKT
jgi:uncharacterized protein (DUF362 family)